MSLETWMNEFMPIPAHTAALLSEEEVVKHSIKKYEGLTPENKAKHGVFLDCRNLHDVVSQATRDVVDDGIFMGESTCSLCKHAKIKAREKGKDGLHCEYCLINEATGDTCTSAWVKAVDLRPETRDEKPLLDVLYKTLAFVQEKNEEQASPGLPPVVEEPVTEEEPAAQDKEFSLRINSTVSNALDVSEEITQMEEEYEPKPHIHADLIKAWADGYHIQVATAVGWLDSKHPSWDPLKTYRIAPTLVTKHIVVGVSGKYHHVDGVYSDPLNLQPPEEYDPCAILDLKIDAKTGEVVGVSIRDTRTTEEREVEDGEWIKWEGGPCPVPLDTLVCCRLRGGDGVGYHGQIRKASEWDWGRFEGTPQYEIVEYKVMSLS